MPFAKRFKILRPRTENINTKSVTDAVEISVERITLTPVRDLNAVLGGSVSETVRTYDFHADNYKADIKHGDILQSIEGETEQSFRVTEVHLYDTGINVQRLIGTANEVR